MKTTGKAPPREPENLERDLGWKLVTLAAVVVGVPTTVFCYSWFSQTGILSGLLTLNVLLVGICDAVGPSLCQIFTKQVVTSTGCGGNARLKLKTYIFHERRAILMYTVATVLVSSLIYSQDSNPWNAIVIIAVYGYISGDTSRNQMFRGGGSIRGLVLTPLLSFMAFGVITVLGSLTEVVDVDQCYGAGFLKWLGDIFDTPNPVGQSEITMGRFTASIGYLIAAIYRFEASQLEYSLVSGDFEPKGSPKDAMTTAAEEPSQSEPVQPSFPHDELSADSRHFIAPRRAASAAYELSPPFSILTTPIATISFITFVLTHIPALLLSSTHPLYGLNHLVYAAADTGALGEQSLEAFVKLFANVPPAFLALATVPSVVGLVCGVTWAKGGKEVWRYAERWNVLERDEQPKEELQEQPLLLD